MVTIAATVMLIKVITPSAASAETPAERCKRETTAYNTAWKNTWVQANPGKKPSQAPPPPVPYKCGGGNSGPAPTQPPPSTSEEPVPHDEPTTSQPPTADDSGPNLNPPTDRRDIEHPGPDQHPVTPISPDARSEIGRKYAALGGDKGVLGAPVTAESRRADGQGRRADYEHGSIFWSAGLLHV